MKTISEIIDDFKRKRKESNRRRAVARANEAFQIIEHKGELWFIHHGALFCPCSLICQTGNNKDVVSFLNTIRNLYIERHS